MLLEHGADADAVGQFGWTGLTAAAEAGRAAVVAALLGAGCECGATDRAGESAITVVHSAVGLTTSFHSTKTNQMRAEPEYTRAAAPHHWELGARRRPIVGKNERRRGGRERGEQKRLEGVARLSWQTTRFAHHTPQTVHSGAHGQMPLVRHSSRHTRCSPSTHPRRAAACCCCSPASRLSVHPVAWLGRVMRPCAPCAPLSHRVSAPRWCDGGSHAHSPEHSPPILASAGTARL